MVEDNCVIHCGEPLEIGDNNIIGHSVVIHGSRIGNNCLLGSHSGTVKYNTWGLVNVTGNAATGYFLNTLYSAQYVLPPLIL
jgi:UDP-3-O-[3-hydroxymyristoyl] glucosamine N-acyltransferase